MRKRTYIYRPIKSKSEESVANAKYARQRNEIVQLIKWRNDDENDPITGIIEDPNYNENPVVSLLRSLNV